MKLIETINPEESYHTVRLGFGVPYFNTFFLMEPL